MSRTKTKQAAVLGDERTLGASTAPVLRVARRLHVAERILNKLGLSPREATLVLATTPTQPEARVIAGKITVGRGSAADWPVEDPALSRLHFEVVREDSGCVLRDLKSRNGVRVNDVACAVRSLADGDLIAVGRQTFLFLAGTDTALAE